MLTSQAVLGGMNSFMSQGLIKAVHAWGEPSADADLIAVVVIESDVVAI